MVLYRYFFLLFLAFGAHADYPAEFRILQEPSMRTFAIEDGAQFLGAVVNSDYGQLDFYDRDCKKLSTNLMDAIYDGSDNCFGFIEWSEDPEVKKWFWERKSLFYRPKTHMMLFSDSAIPLLTFDEEGEGGSFIFRDCETKEPLAIAIWSTFPSGIRCLPCVDYPLQNWHVIVINRSLLEEKKIPFVFLIWALLKHSQLHFPDPRVFPYEKAFNRLATFESRQQHS